MSRSVPFPLPELPPHYLRRPRLFELVDRAMDRQLVLVSTAAGTGKTSLLAGWAAQSAHPTAWLTVAGSENAAALIINSVPAIEDLVFGSAGPVRRPAASAASPAAVLADALGRLRPTAPTGANLVIDNVPAADSPADFAALLDVLITQAPSWLHIILLGRRDPPLPLDRLRAGGQLGEIRAAELMFTTAEATELLSRLAPALSAPKVRALTDLVSGWAAGLQLAALAVRTGNSGEDADATRTTYNRLVRSYVLNEVLADESREVVSMLKGLAVLVGGDAQLAGTLTEREDAVDLLADAQARGLAVPATRGDRAFAVHPFIRPVLLDDLADRSPHRAAELHARAAQSLTTSGDVGQALEHWLQAENPAAALRLLAENAADLYDSGHQATVVATITAIPVAVAAEDLSSMIDYTWCHLLVSRRRFLELAGQITWWADRSELDWPLRPRVTMLRSFAEWLRGMWRESTELARAAMDDLGADGSNDRLGRFGWNMLARGRAMAECWTEGADEEWELVLAVSRDPQRRIAMDATRALGQALAGDANRALATAAEVRQNAPVDSMAMLRAELLTAEGIAHREIGHRARARKLLEALAQAPPEPMAYCAVLSLLELTELRLSEADIEGAVTSFESARVAEQDAGLVGDRAKLARVGASVELAKGNTAAARAWAEQLDEPFWTPVTTARVLLAREDRSGALTAARSATPRCARHRVVLDLLWARLARSGDEAIEFVTRAVTEAAAHGMRQTVASEDAGVLALVERVAWVVPADWVDAVRRLAATSHRTSGYEPALPPATLSQREREVLRFLPSRLTAQEIAVELGISVNTLKYHIKTIYRKLGVNSRAEAAELVRHGGVLRSTAESRGPRRA